MIAIAPCKSNCQHTHICMASSIGKSQPCFVTHSLVPFPIGWWELSSPSLCPPIPLQGTLYYSSRLRFLSGPRLKPVQLFKSVAAWLLGWPSSCFNASVQCRYLCRVEGYGYKPPACSCVMGLGRCFINDGWPATDECRLHSPPPPGCYRRL